jgi:hypothetical protein
MTTDVLRQSCGEDILGAARSIERLRAAEGSVSDFERSAHRASKQGVAVAAFSQCSIQQQTLRMNEQFIDADYRCNSTPVDNNSCSDSGSSNMTSTITRKFTSVKK